MESEFVNQTIKYLIKYIYLYVVQERSDMDKVSQVVSLMLCHMTCVAKQIVFHVDADKIEALVAGLEGE